jgi:hypothetical protein
MKSNCTVHREKANSTSSIMLRMTMIGFSNSVYFIKKDASRPYMNQSIRKLFNSREGGFLQIQSLRLQNSKGRRPIKYHNNSNFSTLANRASSVKCSSKATGCRSSKSIRGKVPSALSGRSYQPEYTAMGVEVVHQFRQTLR